MKKLYALLFAGLAALPLTTHAVDWDAARDLIRNEKPDGGAQETGNPNPTVPQWSYGYRTGIENRSLTLFTPAEHNNHLGGAYEGLEGWAPAATYGAVVYPGGTPFTVGNQDPLAPNEIFTSIDDHSGSTSTVIRWTCPTAGVYTYKVAWHDLDPGGGDGAAGYVVINGVKAFGASWPNGRGQGASTTATVNLNSGDVIDVLLNANSSDSSYDTAGTSFTVISGTPPPPTCAPKQNSIISQFSAEQNPYDSVGQNNGTLVNGATFSAGEVEQAFSLDGGSQYVRVPDASSLRPDSVTIEGWVYLTSLPHQAHVMAKSVGTGTFESYSLYFYEGTLQGAICDTNGCAGLNSGFTPQLNRWYHVAYTFDHAAKTHALYVDGVQRASAVTNQVIGYDTHPLTIGAEFENQAIQFFFAGKIDEISLYSRALSRSAIQAIYDAGAAGKCSGPPPPPTCVPPPGAWPRNTQPREMRKTRSAATMALSKMERPLRPASSDLRSASTAWMITSRFPLAEP